MRAPRIEPRPELTTQFTRLDDDLHICPVLPQDVVHCGRVPRLSFGALLLGEIDAELIASRITRALLVHRPSVSFVATSHDAVVAHDIVLFSVCRNDRQAIGLSLVSNGGTPSEHV